MKPPKEIKCPKCQGVGDTYFKDGRWFYECWTCGFKTYLKLLNKKSGYKQL
jgi:phage FluMu protein Com